MDHRSVSRSRSVNHILPDSDLENRRLLEKEERAKRARLQNQEEVMDNDALAEIIKQAAPAAAQESATLVLVGMDPKLASHKRDIEKMVDAKLKPMEERMVNMEMTTANHGKTTSVASGSTRATIGTGGGDGAPREEAMAAVCLLHRNHHMHRDGLKSKTSLRIMIPWREL